MWCILFRWLKTWTLSPHWPACFWAPIRSLSCRTLKDYITWPSSVFRYIPDMPACVSLGVCKCLCVCNLVCCCILQSNRITKIEGLGSLVNLRELYLSHNGIEVLEGLESNVSLHNVHLFRTSLPTCLWKVYMAHAHHARHPSVDNIPAKLTHTGLHTLCNMGQYSEWYRNGVLKLFGQWSSSDLFQSPEQFSIAKNTISWISDNFQY